MGEWKETEFGLVASDWKFIPSAEFCLRVTDGTHDSPKEQKTGKHLITSKHIKGKDVDFENAYLISEEDFRKINERSKVDQWDVIISMIGEYCGFSFVERNETIDYAVKNVGLFKTGDKHKAYWLYYFLNSKIGRFILETNKSGTSQPYLTLGFLRELPILYPSSDLEAKVIVEILSSIDDKIDLLHRQNKTLEQLAETLFRQWFVEPVRRGGEADESWEKTKIGKVLRTELGGTPSTVIPEYWDGDVPWINSGEINEFRIVKATRFITKLGLEKSNTRLMPKGTTVLAITGATLGKISLLEIETCANQSVVGIIPNARIPREYVFLWVKNKIEDIIQNETGGAQPHINKNDVNETEIIIPPENLLKEKNKILNEYFEKISINTFQIRTLTQLRDTLLPKLMSGEVRVKI